MSDIASLTGQHSAIRDLVTWAGSARTNLDPTAVLSGPSGCGKTWVAEQVADLLPDDTTIIFARGDRNNTRRDYLPFLAATMFVSRQPLGAALLPEAAKVVPHIGSIIGFVLQYIVNRRETEQARRGFLLDAAEREVLLRLERLAGRRRHLLVLDDLQWWDEKSIALAQLMLSGRVNDLFPFLNEATYLALVTTGQRPASPSYESLYGYFRGLETSLHYCDEANFGVILVSLGLRTALDDSIARELYRITRGHLALAKQLVDYLNRVNRPEELLAHKVFEDFCKRVLDARVETMAGDAPMLRDVLTCAAAIGFTFSKTELECLARDSAPDIMKCIRAAKNLELLEQRDSTFRFLHELFRQVLTSHDEDENRDLHSRFAKCLQKLRPGDYSSRAQHHYDAEEWTNAHICEIHARLADMREGRDPAAIYTYPSDTKHDTLEVAYSLIEEIYRAFEAGDYAGSVTIFRNLDETLPPSVQAEAACIVASCKTRLLSRRERLEAVALVQRWWSLADDEPELWSRLAMAKVVALGQMELEPDTEIATKELIDRLSVREPYDDGAERMINRIKLRADMLYETDVAHHRLQEAKRYFGPAIGGIAARDPLCYYLALINLLANQIMLARYADACDTAAACKEYMERVRGTLDDIRFPRVDVLGNNTALSGYRARRMSASEAAAFLEDVMAASPPSNDSPLMRSNWAAFSVAAGVRPDPTWLKPRFEELMGDDFEAYFVYFVGNNLAAIHLALGNLQEASQVWQRLDGVVGGIDLPIRREMALRHARLRKFVAKPDATLEGAESLLRVSTADAVAPTWDHHAHVFLLSELNLWAEG